MIITIIMFQMLIMMEVSSMVGLELPHQTEVIQIYQFSIKEIIKIYLRMDTKTFYPPNININTQTLVRNQAKILKIFLQTITELILEEQVENYKAMGTCCKV